MSQTEQLLHRLSTEPSDQRIIIIGAGIVGSALGYYLSGQSQEEIIVLDRSLHPLRGSTEHAPGYVGQLNDNQILTFLAKESVEAYRQIPGGFDNCGCLEVAWDEPSLEALHLRHTTAKSQGIDAVTLTRDEAVGLAKVLIKDTECTGALYFPGDGTADARRVTSYFRQQAELNGVVFAEAEVQGLIIQDSRVTGIQTGQYVIPCSSAVLAAGIWTSALLGRSKINCKMPIFPVEHPYIHSRRHVDRPSTKIPFVRIPSRHIYLRDHGDHFGIGSYAHRPRAVDTEALCSTAIWNWPSPTFDECLSEALKHVPENTTSSFFPYKTAADALPRVDATEALAFNGLFSVTPDNLPMLGPVSTLPNLYVAAAVWVTHAAGCAKALANMMATDGQAGAKVPKELKALDPARFDGIDDDALKEEAMRRYSDIYFSGAAD